jgi:hypothetical protein
MGTPASIAVKHGDNIKSIYVHWDGYPEHVGKILNDRYNSALANQLVALGDMSELHERITPTDGVEHSYAKPEKGVCVFYMRDRGETSADWIKSDSIKEWAKSTDCDHFYLMDEGLWYYIDGTKHPLQKPKKLSTVLKKLPKE